MYFVLVFSWGWTQGGHSPLHPGLEICIDVLNPKWRYVSEVSLDSVWRYVVESVTFVCVSDSFFTALFAMSVSAS